MINAQLVQAVTHCLAITKQAQLKPYQPSRNGSSGGVAGLDTLRLGFEAGQNHGSELGDYFDGNDETDEGLAAACLMACLGARMGEIRAGLFNAFGSNSLLFWSLYRSIWPDFKRSSDEDMNGLLSLNDIDMADIDRPWQFVTHGWIDFAEE